MPAWTPSAQARLLLRLSEVLAASHTLDQVSHAVMQIATEYLGASYGGVAVLEADRVTMRYDDLQHLDRAIRPTQRFALSSTRPAAVAAREDRIVLVESVDASTELDPVARQSARLVGGQAMAYLPMRLTRRIIGAIALMWPEPMTFTARDTTLFTALARYTAYAVDRALLLQDRHHVASVLQSALLPQLPTIDWLTTVATYRAAGHHDEVGGDWYDLVSLPHNPHDAPTTDATGLATEQATELATEPASEQVMAVVGDVAGHDTHAAAYMGRVQAKLRALALDRPTSPGQLLERLERVTAADRRLVTAIVATLTQPNADQPAVLRWSNAGHPPPVLLEPDRPTRFLDTTPQLLLGLPNGPRRRTDQHTLQPGSTVLLYTDGLIERRGNDLSTALDTLLTVIDHHRHQTTRQLVDTLTHHAGTTQDDTVILAITLHDTTM